MQQTLVITHTRGTFNFALTSTPEYPGEEKEILSFERGCTESDMRDRVMRQYFEYCARQTAKGN